MLRQTAIMIPKYPRISPRVMVGGKKACLDDSALIQTIHRKLEHEGEVALNVRILAILDRHCLVQRCAPVIHPNSAIKFKYEV